MSTSVSGGEPYSCNHLSIPQLIRAAKVKLRDSSFRGTVTTTMNKVEVALLEQDVLEVLSFVQSMRNKSAPVNQIPGEILSLVPKYLKRRPTDKDEDFVALTHVCHGWRHLFISHPSLWTRLNFTNVDKTRTFIERSKSLPLDIVLHDGANGIYFEDAFILAVPHVLRFRSLTIGRTSSSLRTFTRHIHIMHPMPLLEEVTMDFTCNPAPSLIGLYGGSLLRTLKLTGVVTNLPWRNMRDLTTFELRCRQCTVVTAAELLDFLKSAPNLEDITLEHSIPPARKASSRVVHLHRLKKLTIIADQGCAVLIKHLFIPEKASLALVFGFGRNKSPIPNYIPPHPRNLKNISQITTVNLLFARAKKFVRLVGPSGELNILGYRGHKVQISSPDLDRRILHSVLSSFPLDWARRLTITEYEVPTPGEIDKSPAYGILHRMRHLRTLQLVHCNNLPFILALNPTCSPCIPCPYLEVLVIYSEGLGQFDCPELVKMVKERASSGVKLWSIKIIGPNVLLSWGEVSELREHVTHVEHMLVGSPPAWNSGPNEEEEASGVLTSEQKQALAKAFDGLGGQRLSLALGIIYTSVPGLINHGGTIKLDLDILPPKILIDFYSFLIQPLRTV